MNSSVPNKDLRPLIKQDDRTKFQLTQMIFQLAQAKMFKNMFHS